MFQRTLPAALAAVVTLIAVAALAGPAPQELADTVDDTVVADVIPSLPARIIRPGVYHVLAPLTGPERGAAIRIEADDVVLDLGDHRLTAGRSEEPAIQVVGPRRNVTIRRGTLVGFGKATLHAPEAVSCRVEQVTIRSSRGDGMVLGTGAVIEDATVLENRGAGILTGPASRLRSCTLLANGDDGLRVGAGSLVLATIVADNGGVGIVLGDDTVLSEVTTRGNALSGIQVADNVRLSATTGQGARAR